MQQFVHVDEAMLAQQSPEKGFSLVEVIIALLILTIVVLGVFSVFAFATTLNTGNSTRSQALAILQKEVELLRSAKFTPSVVSNVTTPQATCATADDGRRDVTGGAKATQVRCDAAGALYLVETTVDDDPFTTAVQVNAASTLKDIVVTVTPRGQNGTWMSAYRTRALIRRVRAN